MRGSSLFVACLCLAACSAEPDRETETSSAVVQPPSQGLFQGAADGDWCGNSRVSDSEYIKNRSIGAFKCGFGALCSRFFPPRTATVCATAISTLLESTKDKPDGTNVLASLAGAALQNFGHELTVASIIAGDPGRFRQLVSIYGEARAVKMVDGVVAIAADKRLQPLGKVPTLTWVGLLTSCAETIRGACDLAANTVYMVQEGWEAVIDPDFKGSVPGCSKSTATAVTDYTYVFWNSRKATVESCIAGCRAQQDSCGGSKSRACYWWNACVNYCAAVKGGSVDYAATYRMQCETPSILVANAYLQCLKRAPSEVELTQWVRHEGRGVDVVAGICQSDEAKALQAAADPGE